MSRRLLEGYYWLTPLFALVDWTFGANVRAAGLADHPELRVAYYALCTGCAVGIHARPALSGPVGFAESSANLLLLFLSLLLPYYGMLDDALRGSFPAESPITTGMVWNFLIAGSVWVMVFQGHLHRMVRRSPA